MTTTNQFKNYCQMLKDDLEPLVINEGKNNLIEDDKTGVEKKLINDVSSFLKDYKSYVEETTDDKSIHYLNVYEILNELWRIYSQIDFYSEQILDPAKCLVYPNSFDKLTGRIAELSKKLNVCYQYTYALVSGILISLQNEKVHA